MNMKAKLMVLPALLALGAGSLPAMDSQLLSLVMPGAQVLADVNVEQAKATPFGQYVLAQIQSNGQHLQNLETLTGFDPSRDLTELLLASTAPGPKNGLVLARGVFDAAKISAAATQGGATSETYKGVTILVGPKANGAVAFPSPSLAIAGDLADVKGAIDRLSVPAQLNQALAALVAAEASANEDAWVASTLPPSAFPQAAQNGAPVEAGVFQNITQFSGGVKFGNTVALTGQAQTQRAEDAASLASVLQFLANMAATNSKTAGPLAGVIGSTAISAQGNTVTVTASLPEDQFQQLVKQHAPRGQTSRAPR